MIDSASHLLAIPLNTRSYDIAPRGLSLGCRSVGTFRFSVLVVSRSVRRVRGKQGTISGALATIDKRPFRG